MNDKKCFVDVDFDEIRDKGYFPCERSFLLKIISNFIPNPSKLTKGAKDYLDKISWLEEYDAISVNHVEGKLLDENIKPLNDTRLFKYKPSDLKEYIITPLKKSNS